MDFYVLGCSVGTGFISPSARENGTKSSNSSRVHLPFLWILFMTCLGEYNERAQPLVPNTWPDIPSAASEDK